LYSQAIHSHKKLEALIGVKKSLGMNILILFACKGFFGVENDADELRGNKIHLPEEMRECRCQETQRFVDQTMGNQQTWAWCPAALLCFLSPPTRSSWVVLARFTLFGTVLMSLISSNGTSASGGDGASNAPGRGGGGMQRMGAITGDEYLPDPLPHPCEMAPHL